MTQYQIRMDRYQKIIDQSEVITNYQEKIKLINNNPLLIFNLIRLGKSSSVLEANAKFASAITELLFNINNLTPSKFVSLLGNITTLNEMEYQMFLDTTAVKCFLGEEGNSDDVGTILIEKFLNLHPEKRNFILVVSLLSNRSVYYFQNWVRKNLHEILKFDSAIENIPLFILEEYIFKMYNAETPLEKYKTFLTRVYHDIYYETNISRFDTRKSNYLFSDDFWDIVVNANTINGDLICRVLGTLDRQNIIEYTEGKTELLLEQISSFGIENIARSSLFSSNIVTIDVFDRLIHKCNVPAFINNLIEGKLSEHSSTLNISKVPYNILAPFLNKVFFVNDTYNFNIYQDKIPRALELANTGFIKVNSFQYNMISAFIETGTHYLASLSEYIKNILFECTKVDSVYTNEEKIDIIHNIIIPVLFKDFYSRKYKEKFFDVSAYAIKVLVDIELTNDEFNTIRDKFNAVRSNRLNPIISELTYAGLCKYITPDQILKLLKFSDHLIFSKFIFVNIPEDITTEIIEYIIRQDATARSFTDWNNVYFLAEYILKHDTHVYAFKNIIDRMTTYTIRDICGMLEMNKEMAIRLIMTDIHGDLLRKLIPYKVRKLKEVEAMLSFK